MAQDRSHVPFELDARDPHFGREMLLWSSQVRREMQELVASTQDTIAASRALMAEVDRTGKENAFSWWPHL